MSKVRSCGGGESSLGYLFSSGKRQLSEHSHVSPPPIKASLDNDDHNTIKPPLKIPHVSNNYPRTQGQNVGNFITGKPTTKVKAPPGGDSSLGYLFGSE